MPEPYNILIHQFEPSASPYFDDEGDEMLGFYFQFTDEADQPISDMIGPYSHNKAAEKAAMRAFNRKDF